MSSFHRFCRCSLALLTPAFLTGCGPASSSGADAGDSETFIALQSDFAGYESWNQFDGGNQPIDNITLTGQRTLYVNKLPPAGATTFPIGTIIVKTTVGAQTFAMAKRGGGFNAAGAADWEWFEITESSGSPLIVWRGTTAPLTEVYASVSSVSCNACHTQFSDNDYVGGASLQLPAK